MDGSTFPIFRYPRPAAKVPRAHTQTECFRLPRNTLLSMEGDRRGSCVTCHSGLIWLTQEGDPRDHILKPGATITVATRGKVIIQSLDDAHFSLSRS